MNAVYTVTLEQREQGDWACTVAGKRIRNRGFREITCVADGALDALLMGVARLITSLPPYARVGER